LSGSHVFYGAIIFLQVPEPNQNMPYLSSYHRPVPNSAKFYENLEILWKLANFSARLKNLPFIESCGPRWHCIFLFVTNYDTAIWSYCCCALFVYRLFFCVIIWTESQNWFGV